MRFRGRAYSELAVSPRTRPPDGKKLTQHQTWAYIGVLKLWAHLPSVHRQCVWECWGLLLLMWETRESAFSKAWYFLECPGGCQQWWKKDWASYSQEKPH